MDEIPVIEWPKWTDLLDWAAALPPDASVGRAGECEACILSVYLHEQHPDHYFWVNPGGDHPTWKMAPYAVTRKTPVPRNALPPVANEIGTEFDEAFAWVPYAEDVTAGEFLAKFTDRRGK